MDFRYKLSKIRIGGKKLKKEKKKITNLYDVQDKVIKVFKDYSKKINTAIYDTKHWEGIKILTPKQILQRLPPSLAKVKSGNASENLLNEIHQII